MTCFAESPLNALPEVMHHYVTRSTFSVAACRRDEPRRDVAHSHVAVRHRARRLPGVFSTQTVTRSCYAFYYTRPPPVLVTLVANILILFSMPSCL